MRMAPMAMSSSGALRRVSSKTAASATARMLVAIVSGESRLRMSCARAVADVADVADDIHRAARDNEFLVISHRTARWQYRMKRLSPETFFNAVLKATRSFTR